MRRLWTVVSLLLPALLALPALANGHHSEAWARNEFSNAERMRESLNGRPTDERASQEYQRVIDAYREVYYGAPASTKAAASVEAVAELLVEMGRRFDDLKALHSAIGQYEFLRREYPGSRYRFEALFTIGEIYKDDLGDSDHARATFEEFLRRYPHHHLADQARAALAEPVQQAALRAKDEEAAQAPDQVPDKSEKVSATKDTKEHEGKLARVTSIRHWSTPNYTRVAVDLEDDVAFQSQRIDAPDRIVFDLDDTRLASALVGKTFDVDDGLLKKIRVAQFKRNKTRVVLELQDISDYHAFLLPNPPRLIVDIHGKQTAAKKQEAASQAEAEQAPVENSKSRGKDSGQTETDLTAKGPGVKRTVVEDDDSASTKLEPAPVKPAGKSSSTIPSPQMSVAAKTDTREKSTNRRKRRSTAVEAVTREAQPTADGDRSLIRALGLKIGKIVIDPGHGGHDTGTIGPNGLEEKDLVLDVSRRLGKLLETRLGAEVVYTRKDDTFVPLETRTAIANQEQADLFVSVHANSSRDPEARGVETYYLNFTSSPDALEVAARENAVSEKSIHELQDLVKTIALKEKIDESREFASDVERSLHSGLAAKNPGVRDRGVKKAPFIVLIGANMPSILAEISFVSNPGDERRLRTPEYRQRIAESLYRGIAKYVSGLSGVKVAGKIEKGEAQ